MTYYLGCLCLFSAYFFYAFVSSKNSSLTLPLVYQYVNIYTAMLNNLYKIWEYEYTQNTSFLSITFYNLAILSIGVLNTVTGSVFFFSAALSFWRLLRTFLSAFLENSHWGFYRIWPQRIISMLFAILCLFVILLLFPVFQLEMFWK
jgi:hypothetical protein